MTDSELSIDFETFSEIDIKKSGAHRYAQDESTEPLCMAWGFDDEEPALWLPDRPLSNRVIDHILNGGAVVGWNVEFERLIWRHIMVPRFGWPSLDDRQLDCTMTRSLAMNMPGKLEKAGPAFRVTTVKDDAGHRIMLKLSRPRKPTKNNPATRWLPSAVPDQFEKLYAYCLQDVRTERAIRNRTIALRHDERRRWLLNMQVNDRGLFVDKALLRCSLDVVRVEKKRLDAEMRKVTDGVVKTIGAVKQLKDFVTSRGVEVASLDKDGVSKLLARDDLPDDARRAIEIRAEAAKASTAKLRAFQRAMCDDGTVKGTLQFVGASQTGRDGGRLVQPQNMPRPDPKAKRKIELAIEDILSGDADLVRAFQGSPMGTIADILRGIVSARPRRRFYNMDLSQIEARMDAWLAGHTKLLDAYRAYDRKEGPDLYIVTAAGIYNVDPGSISKEDFRRQVGKVACIATDELVLTDRGLVAIQNVTRDMLLWDGTEWVEHEGVVYKGEREVISYDGLTATEDHIVFTRDGRTLRFGDCAREQIPLAQTGLGRQTLRYGCGDIAGGQMETRFAEMVEQSDHPLSLCSLWNDEVGGHEQFAAGNNERLSELFETGEVRTRPADWVSGLAVETSAATTRQMHEPEEPAVSEVRRSGDSVRVLVDGRRGYIHLEEPEVAPVGRARVLGAGSARQRQGLRTGQPPLPQEKGQRKQPRHYSDDDGTRIRNAGVGCVSRHTGVVAGDEVRGHDSAQQARGDVRGRSYARLAGSEVLQTRRGTWDIVNAGPRHRFTVSDRLVHNCLALGFMGGAGAFASMAKIYGVDVAGAYDTVFATASVENREKALDAWKERGGKTGMTKQAYLTAEMIKLAWREDNYPIVELAYGLRDAAIDAVNNPGQTFQVGKMRYRMSGSFLRAILPSGRSIFYPYARIVEHKTPWGKRVPGVDFEAIDGLTKQWKRHHLNHLLLIENAVQAASRDVLFEAWERTEAAGYPCVLRVHDELIAETAEDFGSLDEFRRLFVQAPAWADGLPLNGDGWVGYRYKK